MTRRVGAHGQGGRAESLFGEEREERRRGKGPPNRMNDLVYRDWMKFQKSFFWYLSDQSLVEECISFFTKSVWQDGEPSKTLVVGCDEFSAAAIPAPRKMTHVVGHKSMEGIVNVLRATTQENGSYDFVLLDLRDLIERERELDIFVETHAHNLFQALRRSLAAGRYCCVLAGVASADGGGFPFAWAIASAGRSHLRLRDEKVGLIKKEGRVFYCLFMQAESEERPAQMLTTDTFTQSALVPPKKVPAWIIPKPPPRKPNEILHPAKFPETLIEELIQLHSEEGDNILDPMVGTGSTVLAASRVNRHGYGVDLSERFVAIARERIDQDRQPSLFEKERPEGHVFVGDATRLDDIRELDGIEFQYAVTSPPYWSMLRNPGNENQKARRRRRLPTVYSDDRRDLGNIVSYDHFLNVLEDVYNGVAETLSKDGALTVIIKNVKRNHILHTLAWDLACRLCSRNGRFEYAGTTLWCQDDVSLKPFAVGIYWVSNILHTYCVHFRKRTEKRKSGSAERTRHSG